MVRMRLSTQCLLVGGAAVALYSHPKMLNGEFVYDDGGTVTGNPVTLGQTPWAELWRRDYWGHDPIDSAASHKSFRPITTASFRLNVIAHRAASRQGGGDGGVPSSTFGFHAVNVALHTAVSLLVLPVAALAFRGHARRRRGGRRAVGGDDDADAEFGRGGDGFAALASALVFAVQPVHSEAVQNITGRAEVLMALFFLLGFLAFAASTIRDEAEAEDDGTVKAAHAASLASAKAPAPAESAAEGAQRATAEPASSAPAASSSSASLPAPVAQPLPSVWPSTPRLWAVLTLGLPLCTALSLLCKETGATLPLLCSYWDFFACARLRLGDLCNWWTPPHRAAPSPSETTTKSRLRRLRRRRLERWAVRTCVLALGFFLVAAWRISLNGGHPAYFRYNANR